MPYLLIALAWFIVALGLGVAGFTQQLNPPAPQVVIVVLSVLLVGAIRVRPGFRAWLESLGWRPIVALHLVRFVGFYFLYLYGQGELPRAFAVPGGIGDITVATVALGMLVLNRAAVRPPAILVAWNVLGLIDILFVVVNAARLGLAEPASMSAMLRPPLSLLPTMIVPLIIASHIWLFGVGRGRGGGV